MAQPRGPEYGIPQHQRLSRRPYFLWNNARQRSKTKGISFSITQEWVQEKFEQGVCEITGLPFGDMRTPFAPSLDQINPGKGYTPDNTQMTVWIYNSCKGKFTHEDVLTLAHALTQASK